MDGQTLALKDLTMPAVESGPGGAGPSVAITSPSTGAFYLPGTPVNLQGSIADGAVPYQYEWQLDDGTLLDSGTALAPGDLPLLTTNIPAAGSKGQPGSETVHLIVTDNNGIGITREAVVSLVSPAFMYLPTISQGAGPASAAAPSAQPEVAGAAARLATNYSFGVEYGSDYPPYAPQQSGKLVPRAGRPRARW